jgi:hypothetical protein
MSLKMSLPEGDGLSFRAEGGGWLHVQRPEPALSGQVPAVLLARSAQLPGNFRYGAVGAAEVVLLGEVRGRGDGAEAVLLPPVADGEEHPATLAEQVEAALEAAGIAWKRREEGWVVPASARLPREIQIAPHAGGVRVEAALVGWDEIGELEATALGRLLCRAQFGLRFARCELDARQARVAALVEAAHLDRDLPDSLSGVAAGSRLLAREVGILLAPDMARTYLDFLSAAG